MASGAGDASPEPGKAAAVKIQLLLLNAPHTTVWWDDITPKWSRARAAAGARRRSTRPTTPTAAQNVAFIAGIEKAVPKD
jgi:hypothetical protein